MKKAYHSLDLRYHPDKNEHSQVSDVTKLINEANEELEITLGHNDEIKEEERVRLDEMSEEDLVRMTQNAIIILSDEKYDSGRRQMPSKPVM